jgi:hypothetical protein
VKILIKKHPKKEWKHLSQTKYSREDDLKDILFRDPKVFPVGDIFPDVEPAPIHLMLKEVYLPDSGSVDLLGIDTKGSIYIIETKLARNPEIKREVIGQVWEYAAFMKGQSVNWLNEIVVKQTKGTLEQNFVDVSNLDMERFMQNLQDNMEDGTFRMFIIVDKGNPTLQRTINFINDKTEAGIEIHALELRYFNDKEGTEILVPHVYAAKKPVIDKPRGYWTKEKFFEEADKYIPDEKTRQTLRDLFEFGNKIGTVEFGAGRTTGTFSVSLKHKDSREKLFFISYKSQFTWFPFKEMVRHGINRELVLSYIKELKSLGFELDKESIERTPTFDISLLNDEEQFNKFKKYCIALKDKLLLQ